MPSRRSVLAVAGVALSGCVGGGEPTATPSPTRSGPMTLASAAFEDGGTVPTRYTCEGENGSPPLAFDEVPDGTASFALVVDDPDAPREEPFVHWLLWNLPGDRREIPEGVPKRERAVGARQGTNSAGSVGYTGPCPPTGDGAHTYRFQLHALDATLDLAAGAERDALASAMTGHVLGRDVLRGRFDRN